MSSYSYINVNVNINIYDMLQHSYSRFSNHPFPTEVLDQKKIVHFAEEHLICRSFPAAFSRRAVSVIGMVVSKSMLPDVGGEKKQLNTLW